MVRSCRAKAVVVLSRIPPKGLDFAETVAKDESKWVRSPLAAV
ncbi:MAG: hypothetical protein ACRCTX_10460 [Afipia sp.]